MAYTFHTLCKGLDNYINPYVVTETQHHVYCDCISWNFNLQLYELLKVAKGTFSLWVWRFINTQLEMRPVCPLCFLEAVCMCPCHQPPTCRWTHVCVSTFLSDPLDECLFLQIWSFPQNFTHGQKFRKQRKKIQVYAILTILANVSYIAGL